MSPLAAAGAVKQASADGAVELSLGGPDIAVVDNGAGERRTASYNAHEAGDEDLDAGSD